MVSRRQAAWGESMRDAGAAVDVGEAGGLGHAVQFTLRGVQRRAAWCQGSRDAAVQGVD